ncbi:Short-chain dehydrogenase/reductase SDR [Macrophomina phaseolina MS6]|uniref:Short-chain dehydrogenase/reductase SDR n=1 Tax=Macrophomina phaseolina (strain MS6) TaxID=1126212 RepID=K2SW98_MACPH|nr:Short-chain dehydrogenase/reductase SDR [Macrophomina phaseolina MS6]
MTSHPDWGVRTRATDAATAFSNEIKGRYVLITGVSRNSLGEASALAIAVHDPALLILASRTQSNLDEVAAEIHSIRPSTAVMTVQLDLLSLDSVRRAVADIRESIPRLDVLINNAGMVTQTRRTSPEGVEAQFATNHLGPFLLTNLLAPKLLAAAADAPSPGATRVVNVSSLGLRLSPVRFHDYNLEGAEVPPEERGPPDDALPAAFTRDVDGYRGFMAYGQSKTANVLFAVGLTERLRAKGVVAYALHPGSIWTNLSRDLTKDGYAAIEGTATDWKSPDEGAATIVVAAFDPALNEPAGSFLSDCQYYDPPSYATDPEVAEKLWGLSEELVKEQFEYSAKL